MMIFIGIDPGASGGIAFVEDLVTGQREHGAVKMPDTERDILEHVQRLRGNGSNTALIEKVNGRPRRGEDGHPVKNGAAGMFKFGMGYGGLRMALVAAKIPFEEVEPRKWQAHFSLLKRDGETQTQKKNRHKAKAQQLFPSLKITHATADALLIAEYCRRVNQLAAV